MDPAEALIPLGLSGFHIAITLLALYRARRAVRLAGVEGRADRGTVWRLAGLRLVAAVVILSGGLLAICTPLFVAAEYVTLPTTQAGMAIMIAGAWVVWIPATLGLDNLAWRWLRRTGGDERGETRVKRGKESVGRGA